MTESVHEYIKENVLLFDGAMGTYYAAKHGRTASACELANMESPQEILDIHKEYISAGAKAIKTNTYACSRRNYPEAQCRELIREGWRIAVEATKDADAFVFADIGPVFDIGDDGPANEYRFAVDVFLELGAKNFLFETNSMDTGILETAAYIRSRCPESFIIASFAVLPDGFTAGGIMAGTLLRRMAADPAIDAVGLNCVTGAGHMAQIVKSLGGPKQLGKPMSIMPDAGYPTIIGPRAVYSGAPGYFASQSCQIAECGVKILGGCCGTTPEHIAAVCKALKEPVIGYADSDVGSDESEEESPQAAERSESAFWQALNDPEVLPFAVEFDPPETPDVTKFMAGVKELKESGAAIVTIPDCPVARARMDSSILACKIHREIGIEALPHMTCRDRNLNATKALLLGLSAEDIRNVLVITGDPIPTASRDEVKSVYNFNSRMLAGFITSLGETVLASPFHVFGALNVNVRNFNIQLHLAEEKIKNGVCGFLTQPVLTEQGFENLKLAREVIGERAKLLGGLIPVVSYRNAMFMNSEVAGISVDEKIIAMYEGLNREQGEKLGEDITVEIAKRIAPYIDGYYLITPFNRAKLMARIMERIREENKLL